MVLDGAWRHVRHWIWTNFGQLVPYVVIYLPTKFCDDPSSGQRLAMIYVFGIYRKLVRVLCFRV